MTNKVEKIGIDTDNDDVADKFISFDYDAMGNRIAKHVDDGSETVSTFYILDAQGNQMAMYKATYTTQTIPLLTLEERAIYGSSRVGMESVNLGMTYVEIIEPAIPVIVNYSASRETGDKRYELSNHLGNVLNVITDRRIPEDANSNNQIDYFSADVVSYSDYYPYGMTMPNRNGSAGDQYRYSFNGMEKDDEVKGSNNHLDFGARCYDPRVGRWLSIDPLESKYPDISPYTFVANTPLMAKDPDGRLIIFINGEAPKEEWGKPIYWSYKFISRMKDAFGDHKAGKYVNGDIGYNGETGHTAWSRRKAGYAQAKADWNDIVKGLKKNADGKITETIKIVSHSKGGAFGIGYAKRLRKLRKANEDLFTEDGGKVEAHIMLAPHQSGSSAMTVEQSSTTTIAITHDYDPLSDGAVKGKVLNIETDNDQYALEVNDTHTIDGFHFEAEAAAKKVTENKKNGEWGAKGVKAAVKKAAKKQGNKLYNRKTRKYEAN